MLTPKIMPLKTSRDEDGPGGILKSEVASGQSLDLPISGAAFTRLTYSEGSRNKHDDSSPDSWARLAPHRGRLPEAIPRVRRCESSNR